METLAILLSAPEQLSLARLPLTPPGAQDVVVDIDWSGISTGTERLLWSGRMPPFPGMGYPLVPGYESVGRIVQSGAEAGRALGEAVFVPGARCFGDVRGLFGGAAARLVVPASRVTPVDAALGADAVLLALAATAHHAMALPSAAIPELIIGHGVLGRLLARIIIAAGHPAPMVWESNAARRDGALGYVVCDPAEDARRDYRAICDVSGDASLLDALIARLAPGGVVTLAGFYSAPLSFTFPPAFMREARIAIAAEWKQPDLEAVNALIAARRLSLSGLITHQAAADAAPEAYRQAFEDPACLKMVLDWRNKQ
ncbi:MAG: BchC [Pseudomonadota bacterium]|nr:chlorophyll synthesis pathway protein BchC [Acetobacteraceae bacterium]